MLPGLSPTRRRLRAVRHQLRRRRRLVAAVLAGVAALAAVRAVAPPPPETVEVLLAARDLPAGTVLTDDDLTLRPFPSALLPTGTAEAAAGRVLAAPLARGEVVTDVRLVGPALAEAQPGDTVVPVRLPDPGMAALLRPGDEVDLLATDPGTGETSLVAAAVTVLATPTGVPAGPGGAGGGPDGALVVVATSPDAAVRLASAGLSQFLTVSWSR